MKKYITYLAGKVEFEFFIFSGLLAIIFNIIYCFLGKYIDTTGAIILSIGGLLMALCIPLNRYGYKKSARVFSAIIFNALAVSIAIHLGNASGAALYYFPYLISYFHIFREEGSKSTAYGYMAFSGLVLLLTILLCPTYSDQQAMPKESVNLIAYFSLFITFFLTGAYFAIIYQYQINLREKLMQFERKKSRTALEAFFMAQENEKEAIVHELRNNINQGLVTSKMFLELAKDQAHENAFLQKGYELTLATINEMDDLCDLLDPAIIREVGLRAGLEEYLQLFRANPKIQTQLKMNNERIEELSLNQKLSIFRIIQHYLKMLSSGSQEGRACIELDYSFPDLKLVLQFQHPEKVSLKPFTHEAFSQWRNRVEHFGGNLVEQAHSGQFRINIGIRVSS